MEKKTEKTKVYNVIIMDRSGSMWDIQKPAIMGFNEVLGGVKAARTKYAETQEQFITLVLFDSASIDEVYWNADPAMAEHLTSKTYVCQGPRHRSTTRWAGLSLSSSGS